MSKQRRPSTTEPTATSTDASRSLDPDLAEALSHGNQALSERLGSPSVGPQALAEHAATALRIAPRDPAWTERLAEIVARSGLPQDRRELVTLRLRSDQATADEVAAVVRTWLGDDSDELRADLVAAFDDASRDPALRDVELRVADHTALPLDAVRGLCRDLVLLVAFVWDDDEEQAAPGDYLAEESGS